VFPNLYPADFYYVLWVTRDITSGDFCIVLGNAPTSVWIDFYELEGRISLKNDVCSNEDRPNKSEIVMTTVQYLKSDESNLGGMSRGKDQDRS
jgi:hypothetical protein